MSTNNPTPGWTELHSAAQAGDVDTVRSLLERGADPNARESGDNTYPLHWAAANRHLEIVRALLDAGGDVHGIGDVHGLDVIGWATFYHPDGGAPGDQPEVAALLVERGARHHIFSAIALGDPDLIRAVVAQDPQAIERRMSRFERGLTPLSLALDLKRRDIADLLIALGAKAPAPIDAAALKAGMSALAAATRKGVPLLDVVDVTASLAWYASIGFTEIARDANDGVAYFGIVSFGGAELMLNVRPAAAEHSVSLWF